jgi:hypothetical protein
MAVRVSELRGNERCPVMGQIELQPGAYAEPEPSCGPIRLRLALGFPSGMIMGFCFSVGLRWMRTLGQYETFPWMWSLNGAASVLATFGATIISMELSINLCLLTGAAFYLIAGLALPAKPQASPVPAHSYFRSQSSS